MRSHIAICSAVGAVFFASGPALADGAPKWGGLYLGAGIGAIGLSGTERDTHTVPPHSEKTEGDTDWGVVGSVSAGYDFRLSQNVIAGGLVEFDFTNAEFDVHTDDDHNSLQEDYAFNIGGRLGALVGNATLVYVLGGYSRGQFHYDYSDEYSTDRSFDGWFFGGGVEQKIADAWGVKFEYRYTEYDEEKVGFIVPMAVDQEEHFIDADSHTIRLGVSYSLGLGLGQ